MSELMEPDPPVVAPHTDQEIAAHQLIRSGNTSLAVVDDAGTFYGLVTPRRMLEVLAQEHREDLARLGGNVEGAGVARQAAFEPVRRRLVHRLPWLLVGLVGAMASAVIVGAFEAQLETKVLLAFFIPGLVYMADAIGTQTETVIIRGLSVGVSVRRVAFRELVTGLAVGAVVAAAFVLFALLVWGDATVAVAVALALLASCSIATAVAMTLPWLLHRAGVDPAFGSGPLATVIQDLLTIAIYFAIAVPLAT
jgi:magnesium transporter